jgi:hypothetical protein
LLVLACAAISKWRDRYIEGAEKRRLCAKTCVGADQQNRDAADNQYDVGYSVPKEDISRPARADRGYALFSRNRDRHVKIPFLKFRRIRFAFAIARCGDPSENFKNGFATGVPKFIPQINFRV